jgi:hypothetical protein
VASAMKKSFPLLFHPCTDLSQLITIIKEKKSLFHKALNLLHQIVSFCFLSPKRILPSLSFEDSAFYIVKLEFFPYREYTDGEEVMELIKRFS